MDKLPTVSVIIPVRNRPEQIKKCLDSLLSLRYPAEKLEVIVVNDASEDSTPEEIARYPIKSVTMQTHSGPAASRNRGVNQAKGEIIAFVDSDCVVDPFWLLDLVPYFADTAVGAVGGLVAPLSVTRLIERYEEVKSPLHQGYKANEVCPNSPVSYLSTCNLLVRKAVFEEIGGFDETLRFGEDVDFVWRVCNKGHKVLYVPKGKVLHKHPSHLVEFIQDVFIMPHRRLHF